MDSRDSKQDRGRASRRKAFLRASMGRAGSREGGPLSGFAAYSASYVRRVETFAALLAALYPLAYLADDLLSGRIPPLLHYLPPLVAMLALAFASSRLGPTRFLNSLFVATVYAGFALTLRLPNSRAVYIAIYAFAVPFFYFIGGVRAGRTASLGFVGLLALLIALGVVAEAREFRGFVRPYHYAMLVSALLVQMLIAESNERRHARGLEIIFEEHYYDGATGLPNGHSLVSEKLAEGETLALVRLRNLRISGASTTTRTAGK